MKASFARHFCFLSAFVLIFSFCGRPAPQIPANKDVPVDTAKISMLQLNERLTGIEDAKLKRYTDSLSCGYIRHSMGFWYKIIQKGRNIALKNSFHVSYKVYLLDGELVKQECAEIQPGKKQLIEGLEEGLKLMHPGGRASFIVPWYLAWGIRGDGAKILPYTSVRCEVKWK